MREAKGEGESERALAVGSEVLVAAVAGDVATVREHGDGDAHFII